MQLRGRTGRGMVCKHSSPEIALLHLTRAEVSIKPLPLVGFNCDKRVNLLVGPNASGKSTFLRGIKGIDSWGKSGVQTDHNSYNLQSPLYDMLGEVAEAYVEISEDWPRDGVFPVEPIASVLPFLYIPSTRINLSSIDFNSFGDGPEAVETNEPLKALFSTDFGIFDARHLPSAINQLGQEAMVSRDGGDHLKRAFGISYACAKSICCEVLADEAPLPRIEVTADWPGRVVRYDMSVRTTDDTSGDSLYAGLLSSGTQGPLLWVWALVLRLFVHYGDRVEGWERRPAILLIDEIEKPPASHLAA